MFFKDNAKLVDTRYNKHCGVDSNSVLTCWGLNKFDGRKPKADRRFKAVFQGPVKSVSVGMEYFCYILKKGELKC